MYVKVIRDDGTEIASRELEGPEPATPEEIAQALTVTSASYRREHIETERENGRGIEARNPRANERGEKGGAANAETV